ncbi:HTH-10 family transcription regulator (plasmid) [Natrialba magadii ATCC 43099]|uniref:Bacterio-opsin activator HTH domain-containing protein n=1 Tax=Natrialba magadii (strain ATCC 43099 / DSM 3394 / CCM 3739 / CIP 104546 / IAM 13178 / JCM 8861 / NBRC 102185 / NCIMB 2190 / MS3) TaxID=547559 RepID=D3T220_NATMM|nr:helix-turn-helix domain-containing protein [Natrialba magadii]ADD07629.1 HTH-10 family transcription regulator [Natrialba magadii ATCC 43099]ELY27107.1 bacterio-opsin activator HTH domain-containing protein [Natrialba magadii ATCC 43099]
MSMYEVSFKLRHECPYRGLSEQFPGVSIREWYLQDCQVLEITASDASDDELLKQIDALGTVLHTTADGSDLHVIVQSCACPIEESIIRRFERHNCVHLPPTVYRNGWEHYSVIGFDEADVTALLAELDADREIDVLSKTSIEERHVPHSSLFSVDRLFDGLTERQLEALRIALDAGYYNQPRGASITELAEETTVARATFEEHLRKAENKLVTNAGQFVRLLTEAQGDVLRSGARSVKPVGDD